MLVIKCIKCNELKSLAEFSLYHNRKNKTCNTCRKQNNEWYAIDKDKRKSKAKDYYQKNKGRIAKYRSKVRLFKKYSLSNKNYREMLNSQKRKCLICGNLFGKHKPCVDHDHKTGKVRGLLCRPCNLKLHPLEDVEFRLKAESYLNKFKDVEDKELPR